VIAPEATKKEVVMAARLVSGCCSVVVRHGLTTVIVNEVETCYDGASVNAPVKVAVYVPIWEMAPL
jgi:hypothetical protein